jgi:uncharacterized delta-60 repeat protein
LTEQARNVGRCVVGGFCLLSLVSCGGGGGDSGGNPPVNPAANRAPVAANGTFSTAEDVQFSGALPAATDADGDAVTYTLTTLPANGTASVGASGTFTYRGNANFHGSDTFGFRVADSRGGVADYSAQFTITPVNDAPTASGTPVRFGIGDGVYSYVPGPDARAGALSVQSSGEILVSGRVLSGNELPVLRLTAEGLPDASFSADGMSLAAGPGDGQDVAVQSNGKVVVAGCFDLCGSTRVQFAAVRFNADGTLDTAFGVGGVAAVAVGAFRPNFVQAENLALALQADGAILVAGWAWTGSVAEIAIVRFTASGSLDTSFGGGDGIVTFSTGSTTIARDLTLRPDGRILVVGESTGVGAPSCVVLQLTATGSIDNTFGGGDGLVSVVLGADRTICNAIALLPSGQVLVAGSAVDSYAINPENRDFLLMKLNTDGSPDTSFPGGPAPTCPPSTPNCRPPGVLFTPISKMAGSTTGADDLANSISVLADGRILLAGSSGSTPDITLALYQANGVLDTSFGGDGLVVAPLSTDSDWADAAALTADGKIIVSAQFFGASRALVSGPGIAVLRFNMDGSVDTSFGGLDNRLVAGQPFSFQVSLSRFADVDGDSLTYSARIAAGGALPAWLQFDSNTGSFSGIAPGGTNMVDIALVATDPGGLTAIERFLLTSAPAPW